MKQVFVVSAENKSRAERLIRADDLVSRQSISTKSAESLGFGDGYFLVIEGSEEAIKRAEELLKELCKKPGNQKDIIKRIKEEEEKAIEGFGHIISQ